MDNMNLAPVLPEIFLLIAASVILLIDMFLSDAKRHITFLLTLGTLLVCGALSAAQFAEPNTYVFNNMFVSDPMSSLLKIFCYLSVAITLIYSRQYATDRGMLGTTIGGIHRTVSASRPYGRFTARAPPCGQGARSRSRRPARRPGPGS